MFNDDEILALFDSYFRDAPKDEIQKDIKFIDSLGFEGVSFEEYVNKLNLSTSFSINEAGICDDITYSDFFNTLIGSIDMGNENQIHTVNNLLEIPCLDDRFGSNVIIALAA